MNIWFLTSEIPTYNPGGIARYIDNFARYLAAEGHSVTVISRADKAETIEVVPGYRLVTFRPPWDAPAGSPTGSPDGDQRFPYNFFDYWTALAYQFAEEVRELARREGLPDLIEAQEYNGIAYYVQQRQLTEPDYLPGVPVVINTHSPDFLLRHYNEEPAYQFPVYWNGQLEKACLFAADALISPSQYLADQLMELFPDLSVQAFPLPWTDVSQLRAEPPPVEERSVLYFGRLEVRKGVLRLVAEAEKLWLEGDDFVLTLAGSDCGYVPRDTTVRKFLEQRYARWIEAGRLKLPGGLSHDELLPLIQRHAVIVIPSIWENWPNTCIEAMSLEKVVVGSVHGGQAEMIGAEEKAGFLFSWEDRGSLARQLRRALALDPATRLSMGREAHRRIAHLCAPDRVLPRRLEHFERVIADRKAKHPRRFPFVNDHLRNASLNLPPAPNTEPGLVSAVVPFYNMAQFVEETVTSIFASDYPRVEIVIVDDGSTQESAREVLERLQATHPERLRVVRQANQGLATARNTGVEAANGQYVILVDADDQIEPDYLRRAIDVLERYDNVQIVFSWERYFEASQDIFPGWNFEFPYLLAHNQTCPVCVVDRAAWLRFGRNKPTFVYNFEDYESWIAMVAAGCGGVCLHAPLTRYRIRRDGLWQGSTRAQHLYLHEQILREHPKLFQQYGPELFALQNANGSAQTWLKPTDFSPFDRRLAWEDEEIGNLRRRIRELEAALHEARHAAAPTPS
jgi:glycosyltransferase involved in cell wall biosynthesis